MSLSKIGHYFFLFNMETNKDHRNICQNTFNNRFLHNKDPRQN